jgi:hypothetical protein
MKLNSYEIDNQLFNKQMGLYMKIDNLINKRFDELDPDMLSVLTRTLMDLDDKIQIYKKGLQHGEMFNGNNYRYEKEKVGLKETGYISLKEIMYKSKCLDY